MNLDKIHKGKYIPINTNKYLGDISNITFRSSWERFLMKWCDSNPDILYWGSEVTKVQYICGTDGEPHTYYVDFTIKFSNGKVLLVEIKPESQTKQPTKSKGKSKKTILTESLTYIKNKSKWKYAMKYAENNGMIFQIWTENQLKRLGFKL